MIIPPSSTVILLYDGERWVDIQALKVASTVRPSTLLRCPFYTHIYILRIYAMYNFIVVLLYCCVDSLVS